VNGTEVWRYRIRLFRQLPWSISQHFRTGTDCQGRTTAATGAPCAALIRQHDDGGAKIRPERIVFEGKTLTLVTRADNDGKLEQYQIFELTPTIVPEEW
jgi:hypothetical protein